MTECVCREIKFRLWDENAKWWLSRGESVERVVSQIVRGLGRFHRRAEQ